MRLWTIQPEEVFDIIQTTGAYRCAEDKAISIDDDIFKNAYTWLANQMQIKIGPPPDNNIKFPVWAWHTADWKHAKPDMRTTGFKNWSDKPFVVMEIEIPDNQVLLSDETAWHFVLNNSYYGDAKNEDEFDIEMQAFDALPWEEQKRKTIESWQKVFDITPVHTDWAQNGRYIQATFWELKREQIIKSWHYHRKHV